uniref:AMP-binding enzyme C-terminal domain-containing protein n=1 Tax=Aegilops tauschii subsp. strangulata TaxID=200361 RepID=A0A453S085_AEGTS
KYLQVELVLSQHSGVATAVVFGVPDSRLGEKIVACLSIRDDWRWVDATAEHQGEGNEVSAHILQEYCRIKNLSRFKVPRLYHHWSRPFPVTTTGKIKREELKAKVLACMQPHSSL